MGIITQDLYPNYWKEKKSIKLKLFSNIDKEEGDINTM
jgi:hypothetical protein